MTPPVRRRVGSLLVASALASFATVARADPPLPAPIVSARAPTPAPDPPPATLTPPPSAEATPAGAPTGHWVYVTEPKSAPPAPPARAAGPGQDSVYARANTWDLNIDGAFGRFFGDDAKWTGFVRARAGILFVREPLYSAIGLTYEYSSLSNATFGIQAEILHLDSGFWAQLGGLLDVSGHPGIMAAVGFSLVGIEAQYRTYDGLGDGIAIYAKLRAPIGVLAYVFGTRDRHKEPVAPAAPAP
jgi:hypothetical protein